jgi:phosphoribosyl 1,2-cyclic phosphodiesterase
MQVRCWGARGSVPVSGIRYLNYGGDTPCLEIRSKDGKAVVLDCGTGMRRLGGLLQEEGCREIDILLSHVHWDHIIGFPFFKPLHDPRTTIRLHGCPVLQGNLLKLLSQTMHQPHFPVRLDQVAATVEYLPDCTSPLGLGSILVESIGLSHTSLGRGFRLTEGSSSMVFLTDNELRFAHRGGRSFAEYEEFCRGTDLLVHDAEFSQPEYEVTRGWGHSTYLDALDLAVSAGVKRFALFHHNRERSDQELDAIVDECRGILNAKGVEMECFAMAQDMTLSI